MKTITSKLILAVLCALAIISIVSGKSLTVKGNLRGNKERMNDEGLAVEVKKQRMLKGKGGKGGSKSSKEPKSGKGGKGGKGKKGKKGEKSSKSPKGKGGKGKKCKKKNKSSKEPKSGKGKGGKGKNKSSKVPKGKGKKGKGKKGKGYDCEETPTPTPVPAPSAPTPTNSCGLTDKQRLRRIREILSTVTDLAVVDTFGSPQNLAFTWLISDGPNSQFVCPQTRRLVIQRYLLAVVYFSTDGDSWDRCSRGSTNCRNKEGERFEPFLSKQNECKWFGIKCVDGAVTEVILGGNNFVGANGVVPSEIFFLPRVKGIIFDGSKDDNETRRLIGKIPAKIENAKFLEELDLDRNELTGEIPDEIFELNSLKLLDLDNNQLTGVIQDRFDDLPNLRFLTIGNNAYDQQPMPSSIGGLSKLSSVGLQDSSLTGEIPQSYGNLNLFAFDFGNNDLTGSIDVIDNYSRLVSISVNDNRFAGEVPQSLWDNANFTLIDLENNRFTGPIAPSIGEMTRLKTLRLGGNNLTGDIPDALGDLQSLAVLTLQGNRFNAGSFVPERICTNNPNIEIEIDSSIACPGRCCTTVQV